MFFSSTRLTLMPQGSVASSRMERILALMVSRLVRLWSSSSSPMMLRRVVAAVSYTHLAGCGIAWLRGAGYDGISRTICNAVAMISGCICDGAKASCASKIAMAVGTGILGYNMYLGGNNFRPGDGIEGADVEETIRNVGVLASKGMHETDRVILNIMTGR